MMFQSKEQGSISTRLSHAFRCFVTVAENFYPKLPDFEGDGPLEQAYCEFWRLYKLEKESRWERLLQQRREVLSHAEKMLGQLQC